MTAAGTDPHVLKQSFGRVVAKSEFLPRFYEILMASSPEISAKFANTNLKKQYNLLEQSLALSLLFPEDNVVAKQAINKIRSSHTRHNLDISPHLYIYWLDSLMTVFAELDPEFTPAMEQQWRTFLQITIDHIKAGY